MPTTTSENQPLAKGVRLRWAQARNIRTYVTAFKEKFIARYGDIQAGSQLDQWMSWARRQADTMDPLTWIESQSSAA